MYRGCVECCGDGKGGKSECRRVDLTYDGIPAVVLITGGQRFMSTIRKCCGISKSRPSDSRLPCNCWSRVEKWFGSNKVGSAVAAEAVVVPEMHQC